MKSVYHPHADRREPSLAMTPMIDVVFLLLIFFICTASFEAIELILPSELLISGGTAIDAPVEPPPELEQVVVRGERAGDVTRWTVNDAACPTPAELRATLAALAEIDTGLPVVLDADGAVPLGDLIDAYDAGRAAGFQSIRFAASAE